jgi:hypothetical protein
MAALATATMMPPLMMGDMVAGQPLDYSFKELKNVLEMETEEPRSGGKRRPQEQKETIAVGQAESGNADTTVGGTAVSAITTAGNVAPGDGAKNALGASIVAANTSGHLGSTGKALGRQASPMIKRRVRKVTIAVKLNNNAIDSLTDLPQALDFVMDDPVRNLQWIDLSFNQLHTIQPELLEFKQMKALYLHGNHIKSLPSIERLRKLPKLISLTTNGNPVECVPFYRRYVVGALPSLRTLDHSTITADEIKGAADWFAAHKIRAESRRKRLEDEAALQNE